MQFKEKMEDFASDIPFIISFQFCTIQGFAAFDATQGKKKSYHEQHPIYQFLPILHNSRICNLWCGSSKKKELSRPTPHLLIPSFNNWGIWVSTKTSWYVFRWLCQCHLELERARGPSSRCFGYFLCKKISITLQRMQASSILSHVIVVGLSTSRLPPLQDAPLITMTNLLQAIDFWHGYVLTSSLN